MEERIVDETVREVANQLYRSCRVSDLYRHRLRAGALLQSSGAHIGRAAGAAVFSVSAQGGRPMAERGRTAVGTLRRSACAGQIHDRPGGVLHPPMR